jgi:hypothetical protein
VPNADWRHKGCESPLSYFHSYARSDGELFARQILERLTKAENLTCWCDRLDLEGGQDFWRQLEAGISAARWAS